jgi:hypothetical protein
MADLARFMKDVRNHHMTIEIDAGAHRSIRFGRAGSSSYYFRLVTWPGGLSISGDMGDFTFARLLDMFEFFRDPDMENRINASYWHEKMQAQSKSSPAKEFSRDKLKSALRSHMDEWQVRLGDAAEVRSEVEDDLDLDEAYDVSSAHSLVRDFEASDGNRFDDFDANLEDYSFHFLWCLRAIVWGIKQYDLLKQGRTQADHDRRVLAGVI